MSTLATKFDSPEFLDQLAGRYRDCENLAQAVDTLARATARRIEAMRRNAYLGLAEIGDALLGVQESRPGEFEVWFRIHESRLGFSLRTARRCKAAARLIQELGIEGALAAAMGESPKSKPEPFLSLNFRLPVAPEQIPDEEVASWLDRLRPAVAVFRQLSERLTAAEA